MMEYEFKMKLCPRHVDVKFLKEMIDIITQDDIEIISAEIESSSNFKDTTWIRMRHDNIRLLDYAATIFIGSYRRNQSGFPDTVDKMVKRSCKIAGTWSGLEDLKNGK